MSRMNEEGASQTKEGAQPDASDVELKKDITEALIDTDMNIEDLEVSVFHRVVTLDGFLTSKQERKELEDHVAKMEGVRKVINRTVLIGEDAKDKMIARTVIEELKKEPRVVLDDVKIKVQDGVVTLYGTVKDLSTQEAAECAAGRASKEVKEVKNDLEWTLQYEEMKKEKNKGD